MREKQLILRKSQQRFIKSHKNTNAMLHTLTENVEAIDNLIIANEATRDLAQQVGHLAINTSRRVSNLESRVERLENCS